MCIIIIIKAEMDAVNVDNYTFSKRVFFDTHDFRATKSKQAVCFIPSPPFLLLVLTAALSTS